MSSTPGSKEHYDPFDDAVTAGIGLRDGDDEAPEEVPDPDETDTPTGPKPRIVTPAESVLYLPLRSDLKKAAQTATIKEIRYVIDGYYTWQQNRIAAHNQAVALGKTAEPNLAVVYVENAFKQFELDMAAMLDYYTKIEPTGMGLWLRGIMGIGPVLAAAFLAHLDITKAPTSGHFWRYAGLDPTVKWLGTKGAAELVDRVLNGSRTIEAEHLMAVAEATHRRLEVVIKMATDKDTGKYSITTLKKSLARRPWNASLKVVCWKAGESFVKVASSPKDYYGKEILVRKAYEQRKNEAGDYADQAREKIATFNIGHDTDAYYYYSGRLTPEMVHDIQSKAPAARQAHMRKIAGPVGSGVPMLPPGHIHARSKRHAVKLMMSHLHDEMYRRHFKTEPPKPYPIAFMGHTHYKAAPAI